MRSPCRNSRSSLAIAAASSFVSVARACVARRRSRGSPTIADFALRSRLKELLHHQRLLLVHLRLLFFLPLRLRLASRQSHSRGEQDDHHHVAHGRVSLR